MGHDTDSQNPLGCIAHPEVSSVVVEHLLQTLQSMAINEAPKNEIIGVNASAKTSATMVETLESKMARQALDIATLQQDVKVALKNK
jgi:hypothetical protein